MRLGVLALLVFLLFPVSARPLTVEDDGNYVTIESDTIKARWCYDKTGTGWFAGTQPPAGTGGGCESGDLVELYYKPTSTTRNLLFRNNTWGSGFDSLGFWEVEVDPTTDLTDWQAPDYVSGNYPGVSEFESYNAKKRYGRVELTINSTFDVFSIQRIYYIYDWGDITVDAKITMNQSANYAYVGDKFTFAGSIYNLPAGTATNPSNAGGLTWGTNYELDGESYVAFTDGESTNNTSYHSYEVVVTDSVNANSVNYQYGWADAYSGYILDDEDADDPDIIVMVGDTSIKSSPFYTISKAIGGPCLDYIETGVFERDWQVDDAITASMAYFYNCGPSPFVPPYSAVFWDESKLRSWNESFHIMFRTTTSKDDYTRIWRLRSAQIDELEPDNLVNATTTFNSSDKLYHVSLTDNSKDASFDVALPEAITVSHDYVTLVVVDNLTRCYKATLDGPSGGDLEVFSTPGPNVGATLAISQDSPSGADTYSISLTNSCPAGIRIIGGAEVF